MNKKLIIYFLCLFLSNKFISQDLEDLKFSLKILNEKASFKLDSTGLSKLNIPNFLNQYFEEMEELENERKNYFHVQDLNNDGLSDLIYSGPLPIYSSTLVFLNSKKGLQKVFDVTGNLKRLIIKDNKTLLYIFKESCCCDNFSNFINLSISDNNEINEKVITYHYETKVENFNELKLQLVSGILRTTPNIDNVILKDPCTEDKLKGNQILKIENQNVVILDTIPNWNLVLYKKNNETSMLGWIKTN